MRSRLWTTERVGVLRRLWADGKTAVEIAAALDGVSRSAVLGMIFRLRLGADDGTGGKTARTKPAKSRAAAVPPLAPSRRHWRRRKKNSIADTPPRRSGPVGLFDLANEMCRWPHGQLGGRNYLFCGAPGADLSGGIPYCALHMGRAYLIPPRAAAAKTGKINRMSNSGSSACVPGPKATTLRTKSPDAGAALNLRSRAAAAARAELRGDRSRHSRRHRRGRPDSARRGRGPCRTAGRLSSSWSVLEEAFRILARLPMPSRPRGYLNSMPVYLYDRGDLNSQLETYELERMAKLRNRVRIPPSPAEIARMEEALRWPSLFLAGQDYEHVARAVNLCSLWAAFDRDIDKALKPLKMTRRTFNARKLQGLRIIEWELIRRRVPVR